MPRENFIKTEGTEKRKDGEAGGDGEEQGSRARGTISTPEGWKPQLGAAPQTA